jgi:hypothetical protein
VASPAIALYSQGYRIDFQEQRIVQTGAFYFKVSPSQTDIYLDGKLKDSTNFLVNSSLIKGLLPGQYALEVKKDGYYPWQKTLEIKEKQVTEIKNIVLFPIEPDFKVLATTTEDINKIILKIAQEKKEIKEPLSSGIATTSVFLSFDEKKIALASSSDLLVVFLKNQEETPKKKAGDEILITRYLAKINDLAWLNNSYLIYSVKNKIKIAEIDERDRINIIDLAEFKSPKLFWDKDNNKLYVLSENTLYLLTNLLP